MHVHLSCDVYSVLTARIGELSAVEALLYGHTTVVDTHEAGGHYLFVIVKTTATQVVEHKDGHGVGASVGTHVTDEAFRLANVTIQRCASGLVGGIIAGSREEAEELVSDAVFGTVQ